MQCFVPWAGQQPLQSGAGLRPPSKLPCCSGAGHSMVEAIDNQTKLQHQSLEVAKPAAAARSGAQRTLWTLVVVLISDVLKKYSIID